MTDLIRCALISILTLYFSLASSNDACEENSQRCWLSCSKLTQKPGSECRNRCNTEESACNERLYKTVESFNPFLNCKVNDSDINKEYLGTCLNGLANGKGIAKGSDTYDGEFRNGDAHGQGTYTWSSGNVYRGTWRNGKTNGFGVMTEAGCNTCTRVGLWQEGKLVKSCKSQEICDRVVRLETQLRKASNEFRCEDANRLNRELEALNEGGFSFDSCVSERNFNNVVNGSDPQSMYIAAGRYESDGERSRAKTIYRQIMSRFSKDPIAIKATERLTRLADVELVESSNRNAAYQVESAYNKSRDAAYQQCIINYSACYNSCDTLGSSSSRNNCKSGCAFCTR